MLAQDIYYVDRKFTFVFEISLFSRQRGPLSTKRKHAQNDSSVLVSVHNGMCSLQYFVNTMLTSFSFSWIKDMPQGFVFNLYVL